MDGCLQRQTSLALGQEAADSAGRTVSGSIVGPTIDLTDSKPAPHRSTDQSTETPLMLRQTTHLRTSTPEKATASKKALRSGGSMGPAAGWLQTKVSVTAPLSVFCAMSVRSR